VASIVLSPTQLAVVDFDGLVRTTDFLRAAQNVIQYGPSTSIGPISDGCGAELMILLDSMSRNAAKDVVREEQNLHEIEVTLPKS
jgi:hypothetical protein